MPTSLTPMLLMEPNELIADMTAFRLEMLGYQVSCATSAQAAAAHLSSCPPPELILIDSSLLIDDQGAATTFLTDLRSDIRLRDIPVIVLHHDGVSLPVIRDQIAAKDEVVALPYDPAELKTKVARLVQRPVPVHSSSDREHRLPLTGSSINTVAVCTPQEA
jgi:CheY-like chemotaxis protein